ncbi:MAG: hypothetical protein COA79_22890 [Planctomycetota bacterium]|nr:MAG: hypothetical protein COA79_22890 [Planctomycetota bacterium]
MKKLLNPLVVSAFIVTMLLGSLAHLMYGSCQTTKYHYMCQAYWMPDNLPGWMILNPDDEGLYVYDDYTDKWRTWYKEGVKMSSSEYLNGKRHGHSVSWYLNGTKHQVGNYANGMEYGVHKYWFRNGNLGVSEKFSQSGERISIENWFYDGSKRREKFYSKGHLVSWQHWDKDGTNK